MSICFCWKWVACAVVVAAGKGIVVGIVLVQEKELLLLCGVQGAGKAINNKTKQHNTTQNNTT